jgi:molybdopterin-binding protein
VKVGARNHIPGTVTSIAKGKVMCLVKVEVPARSRMASVMTLESLQKLFLSNEFKLGPL